MSDLTKSAILVMVRDRVKWTKIWDHNRQNYKKTNIFKNLNLKNKNTKWLT